MVAVPNICIVHHGPTDPPEIALTATLHAIRMIPFSFKTPPQCSPTHTNQPPTGLRESKRNTNHDVAQRTGDNPQGCPTAFQCSSLRNLLLTLFAAASRHRAHPSDLSAGECVTVRCGNDQDLGHRHRHSPQRLSMH